jgi:hypothetical protein
MKNRNLIPFNKLHAALKAHAWLSDAEREALLRLFAAAHNEYLRATYKAPEAGDELSDDERDEVLAHDRAAADARARVRKGSTP